ncbi:MAG: sugar nucleotide-binding protein, partial [Sphingomonadales bacterium]|nr:sugar nucleotide-binding protein [Sphingomonadales bacterium]
MKVLVTGAGGQVARALVATRPDGTDLVALDRKQLDIGDRVAVLAAIENHRPDMVINAAAFTAVDRAESEPHAAMAVNGTGVGWLADACTMHRAQLVQISTDYVFSG